MALQNRFPEIIAALPEVLDEVISEGVDLIVADAKTRVPVVTGGLRDAIHKDKEPEGTYVVAGDTDAFYGHMVEFGTTHSPPHPFLIPAAEDNQQGIVTLVAKAIGKL